MTLISLDSFMAPVWSYGCIFCTTPLIGHQLTTHKIHLITFWFSFSSRLCIKFSPIFVFLLKVSCCFVSTVGLVHDKANCDQEAIERWSFSLFGRQIGMLLRYYCMADLKWIVNSVTYLQFDIFRKWHSVDKNYLPVGPPLLLKYTDVVGASGLISFLHCDTGWLEHSKGLLHIPVVASAWELHERQCSQQNCGLSG